MRPVLAGLLAAFVANLALATPALPAPTDALATARAKTCAAFLSEMNNHVAAGNAAGTTPSYAIVWAALLKADQANGTGLGKLGMGPLMLDNTVHSCQRVRARTLGATMDAEFAKL